jgi:hypothetical protein
MTKSDERLIKKDGKVSIRRSFYSAVVGVFMQLKFYRNFSSPTTQNVTAKNAMKRKEKIQKSKVKSQNLRLVQRLVLRLIWESPFYIKCSKTQRCRKRRIITDRILEHGQIDSDTRNVTKDRTLK